MAGLKYWLWLSALPVSDKAKAALLHRYGDAETAFLAPHGDYRSIQGISALEAGLMEHRDLSRAKSIEEQCIRQNIRIITLQDALYPKRLKNIYTPPPVLYVKGQLPAVDDNAVIAVIGTRKASPYGIKMAGKLAGEISRCGGIVISGLTAGIDAEAAKAALSAGGQCIGVLGSSHEQSGGGLARELESRGALISEYPPGTATRKSFFRARNRISAGLSLGVVVVEAPEQSGALLFAGEALEQGKEIFAVPGNADAPNSAGTIELLKNGARPVTEGWDVLSDFSFMFPDILHEAGTETLQENADDSGKNELLAQQLSNLSQVQLEIVAAIDSTGADVDDIIDRTGLDPQRVKAEMTMLRIKNVVDYLPGSRVKLKIAKK